MVQNDGLFITLDGIDGCGKSTLCAALALALNAERISTPPEPIAALRQDIESVGSLQTRFLYYMLSVSAASDYVNSAIAHKDIICDRYVYSTLAYHMALGFDGSHLASPLMLRKPDIAFHVIVSDERVRRERVSLRENKTRSDTIVDDEAVRASILSAFRAMNLVEVDTARSDIASTVHEMLGLIQRCRPTLNPKPLVSG